MSKIPSGWEIIPLSEVIQTQKGKKPSDLGPKDSLRTVPYINIAAFETQKVGEFAPEQEIPRCEPNDTLLVWDGARAGLCGKGMSGYIGSTLARVTSDLADPAYLYYFIHSNYSTLNTQTKGVGIPHINPAVLNSLEFPLAPLADQTRIVEKLEELFSDLDAGVAELKAAQKKLAQYRQSLFKAAVEGALTAEWRTKNKPKEAGAQLLERILKERRARWEEKQLAKFKEQGKTPPKGWQDKYPQPVQPNTTNLPELPQGWVWASLDQCSLDETAITDGPFGSNLKSEHYQEHGPRVIRLQNIGDGVFVDVSAHISKEHYSNLLKHSVSKDDLVVAMLGEVLPRACIIPDGVAPAIVKADCARIRVNQKLMLPIIMMAYLNSPPTRERVVSLVKGIGRPRINLGHIRAIAVPICSQAEQQALLKTLIESNEAIEQQFEAIELSLKQAAAQRKNILKSAFTGQLVAQDPNDEPASLLLERIRAERQKQPNNRKPGRTRKTHEANQ